MKILNFKIQTAFLMAGLALSATSQAMPLSRGDTVWSGYYFGSYFGAGAGNARTEITTHEQSFINVPDTDSIVQILLLFNTDTSGTVKGKVRGSIADLFFGYNFQEPSYNLVLGAQLEGSIFSDITWKAKGEVDSLDTISIVVVTPAVTPVTFVGTSGSVTQEVIDRLRSKFALVGRVGYLINPCTLIYGLGGPVAGHFVLPAFFIGGESGDIFNTHKNQWELGYTLGAGLEIKINDHWSLRGEYRYLSFNFSRRVNPHSNTTSVGLFEDLSFAFSSNTFTQSTHTKFHDHLGEIGVVYSF